MKNYKTLLTCAFLIGFIIYGNAQSQGKIAQILADRSQNGEFVVYTNLLSVANEFDPSLLENEVSGATVFNLNTSMALELIEQTPDLISVEIPLSDGSTINLKLYKETEAFSELSISLSRGERFDTSSLKAAFYRGTISGNSNSVVSLSVFENEVTAIISSDVGNMVLGKLKNHPQIVLYNDKDLNEKPDFDCSTPDLPLSDLELVNYQGVFAKSLTLKCVRLCFETEYDITQALGSVPNVVNYVTNLYNQIGTLYANDGISTMLSHITIWNSADPYTATSTASLLAQYQAQISSINGNLGQLLTFRSIGGGMAAGFSGICNSNVDQSLCVSGNMTSSIVNVPTYSWNVMVTTHEFGHLFGSRHTHACVWNGNSTAIDGCSGFTEGGCPLPGIPSGGGTIMSYCHTQSVGINFNLGFGPQPTTVITNNVNGGSCLTSCFPCPVNLIVTTNVLAPNVDYRQASDTITATNSIASGATGIYHAGNQLVFQSGFNSANGSNFRAYIEGCSNNFVIRQHFLHEEPVTETPQNDTLENFVLAPNPNNGLFSLNLKESTTGSIHVTDLYGNIVYKHEFIDANQFEINIQEKPKGIYIVKVLTEKVNLIEKIIKY